MLEDELTRTRTAVDVPVGLHSKAFEKEHVDKAVYATGWDGSVVVSAQNDGTYRVVTSR